MIKRKYLIYLSLMVGVLTLVGCSNNQNNTTTENETVIEDTISEDSTNEIKEDTNTENNNIDNINNISEKENIYNEKDTISSNIIDINEYYNTIKNFFINNNENIYYRGYAEYGYCLNSINVDNAEKQITYTGSMTDGYGEDERGERNFSIMYNFEIEDNLGVVREQITNSDYMNKSTNTLNSIIPNYIIVKGNIEIYNSWEQKFTYNDKEYTAQSKITFVNDSMFEVTTTVKNIEGFNNNTYTEKRTYKKNLGLTSFENTPYYDNQEEAIDDLLFGYNLNEY